MTEQPVLTTTKPLNVRTNPFRLIQHFFTDPQFLSLQLQFLPVRYFLFSLAGLYIFFTCIALLFLSAGTVVIGQRIHQTVPQNSELRFGRMNENEPITLTTSFPLPHRVQLPFRSFIEFDTEHLRWSFFDSPNTEKMAYNQFLSDQPSITLNSAEFGTLLIPSLLLAVIVSTVLTAIGLFLFRLAMLVVYALVLGGICKLLQLGWTFQGAYVTAIAAAHVAEVVAVIYLLLYRTMDYPAFELAFFLSAVYLLLILSHRLRNGQVA